MVSQHFHQDANGTAPDMNSNGSGPESLQHDLLEAIAVVGYSLKFPQDAVSPAAFWKMLEEKRCAMTDWPKNRINLDAFYHPDRDRNDTIYAKGAHFLEEDPGAFDASFFSITANEAVAMDPQQRILLETSYRALENAGISIEKVSGSKTGVYTGSMPPDYMKLLAKDMEDMPKYAATGAAPNLVANRVSWFFNLTGPSVNMDSACSSSLMALDFACQGLRNCDSSMALVAGANLLLTVDTVIPLTNMSFLSPDSRCYSFDDRANGYSRGDGFGVVVIKRVSDAIRDGDTIRAIIRSTGSNQDGRTPGITQPSKEAQSVLIRETYEKAGLDFGTTRFFEAHGTGTAIGDPIEADAIGSVFRKYRSSSDPLFIGASKSNIGHLEGGSGIAGLIKTIMVLEKGIIPPNANFERLNPRIDAEFLNIVVPVRSLAWPAKGLRRASVNSFGFGGSNAHAVLEDAFNFLRLRGLTANHSTSKEPPLLVGSTEISEDLRNSNSSQPGGSESHNSQTNGRETNDNGHNSRDDEPPNPVILVWTSADENGIARLTSAYQNHFSEASADHVESPSYLEDLAHTLAFRRSSFPWKSFAVVDSVSALKGIEGQAFRPCRSSEKLGIAFVFTGQGAQYKGMGTDLLRYPIFEDTIRSIDKILRDLGCGWSLFDEIAQKDSPTNINSPEYSQPLSTALQIALVDMLRKFNILPSTVVGHSSGEIAAAYSIGAISLSSACQISYYRGYLATKLAKSSGPTGAMMSVNLSEAEIHPYIHKTVSQAGSKDITVACINSPTNVTVSGGEKTIDFLKHALDSDNIFARKLLTGVAYHSPQMQQIASDYRKCIQNLEKSESISRRVTMISSVTGEKILETDVLSTAEYWVSNMVEPVRFSQAMAHVVSQSKAPRKKKLGVSHHGVYDLIEIGPHSALQRPVQDILEATATDQDVRYFSVLSRFDSSLTTTLKMAGHLYSLGYSVSLSEINYTHRDPIRKPMMLVDLPEYPFNHSQTYWHESGLSKEARLRGNPRLDLLGTTVADWNPLEARWRKFYDVAETPWIEDHKVSGTPIYPAVGMMVMAIEGARQLAQQDRHILGYQIKDATFSNPIPIVTSGQRTETQLYMRPIQDTSEKVSTSFHYRICILDNNRWNEACRGTLYIQYQGAKTEVDGGREDSETARHFRERYDDAVRACDQMVEKERVYKTFQNIGISYGPAFQALRNLAWNGANEAVGEIQSFQWAEQETQHDVQPHVVHPVTLDGAAQLTYVALTEGGTKAIPAGIPTRIKSAWISSTGLGYPDATVLRAYSKSTFKGLRRTDCSMFALDQMGNLKIAISNMETTAVSSLDSSSHPRQLCYSMDWKPDIDMMTSQKMLAYCEAGQLEVIEPREFFQDLTLYLISSVIQTLEELSEIDYKNTKPHFQKYVDWMRHQVTKFHSGQLPDSQADWSSHLKDTDYMVSLANRLENSNAQGKFFVNVGRNLASLIRGETDPLELLFQDGLAEGYYQEIFGGVSCCRDMGSFLDAFAHKNPALSILEIGAGTGSITRHVLSPILVHGDKEVGTARFARYDYTDISEGFFEKAREKYASEGQRFNFKRLNIENDPEDEGFVLGTYDLVVAGSVLHATQDLSVTIQNARKLLKPGGKLVLFEVVEPEKLRVGFGFGILPGWWLSTEEDRQQNGPCISNKQWDKILSENDFTGVDFELHDFQDQVCHEMSVIVSTAVEKRSDTLPKPLAASKTVILIDLDSQIQKDTSVHIRDQLASRGNHTCEVVPFQELPGVENAGSASFIFLPELEGSFLYDIDEAGYKLLQTTLSMAKRLLWVTCAKNDSSLSPKSNLVTGLARVLRSEDNSRSFFTLAFEDQVTSDEACASSIVKVMEATSHNSAVDGETEFVERDGVIMINRFVEANYLNHEVDARIHPQYNVQEFGKGPPLVLTVETPGLLDSLRWKEDLVPRAELEPHQVEIEIKAVSVNFRDLLVTLGRLDGQTLGFECAGTVTRVGGDCVSHSPGDRVSATMLGCLKTFARCDAQLAIKVPDEMSPVEAAALPITAAMAHYALVELARLQKGETILIHAGSGGTGQMAIQVAQSIGADVYVTVGFDEKKRLLVDLYGIPEDHIFYSRDTTFAQGIMRMTGRRGVDVILNSLSGDSLVASWELMAPYGRFIEIGKWDIDSNTKLPMSSFSDNVSFSAIAADHILVHRPALFGKSMVAAMEMIVDGRLKLARPVNVYPISEVEEAFRFMQSGKNTGKTVLTVEPTDMVPIRKTALNHRFSYDFDPCATYLIAGGLGGLGRSAARWMAARGVKNLILLSRSGGDGSEAASALLKELRSLHVRVEAPKCDVSFAESLSAALSQCSTMPPIKGCIQGTMVLKDNIFENMTFSDWNTTTRSKVQSSWNLHTLLPPDLDFFIMLSSIAGVVGTISQANYAAGNTYQSALAQHRIQHGQKAISIDLGWMGSVGIIAETETYLRNQEDAQEMAQIEEPEFHALLDYYCDPALELATPLKAEPIVGLRTPAQFRAKGMEPPSWSQRPAFSPLAHIDLAGAASSSSSSDEATKVAVDYAAEMRLAPSVVEAGEVVVGGLVRKLAKALSASSAAEIDTGKPMHAYGVDSLLAVELRNWFAKEFKAEVAIFDIMGAESIARVGEMIAERSKVRKG